MKIRGPLVAVAILAGIFGFSLWQIGARRAETLDPDVRVLRIGHWLIHAGMREALDAVIADYERIHPDVRIKQNTVPLKTWFAWQRAQWTGGNTPDLMQLGKGTNDDNIARYYLPLNAHVDAPNPYNAGSPLAGLPWRRTFVEGLGSGAVYYPSFGEVFGIPAQSNSQRMYYNRALLREITGSDRPPATLDELLALRPAADAWRARTGRPVAVLSLCGPYADALFDRVSQAMLQPLVAELSPSRGLEENAIATSQGYLAGAWSLHDPPVTRLLELWAEIAALAPPGHLQLQREEALFNFVTGRALLFFGGSWDYAGVVQEAGFPVGVARFPEPVAGQGRWGEFSLGPVDEAEGGMECILGVSRDSPHPGLALDFLRFLTSHASSAKLTALSRRIPAVIDVPVSPELEPLRPVPGGAFRGLLLSMRGNPGGNAVLQFTRRLHLLDARNRPAAQAAEDFVAGLEPAWADAIRRDLAAAPRSRLQIVRQGDVRQLFAALRPPTPEALDALAESTLDAEIALSQLREPAADAP